MAFVSSDAVPVYLDISTGKILISLDSCVQLGQRRRKKGESATQWMKRKGSVDKVPLDAQGATRQDKNRLTWICRDVLTGVWNLQPEELPKGYMLSSVLIVPAEQPARLQDMSFEEPAVWLRDHMVLVKGRVVHRQQGQPVGSLMRGWRHHRRKCPELYQDKAVLIYGQSQATMDQSICVLLSDQLRQEELPKLGCQTAVVQTDCAGCEHTPLVKAVKCQNNQVDHIIGPKQTQAMQRVDLGHAKRGKDTQRSSAKLLRRKQREKAYNEGCAALLVSKHTEMLLLLRDMHFACVEAAEGPGQAVCQLARMGGFLDFAPTTDGLKPVEGECWNSPGMASGSSRMKDDVLRWHREWVQQHGGKPPSPDWQQLSELRDRLQTEAAQRLQALKDKRTPAPTAAAENEPKPISGFIDILPGGEGLSVEQTLDQISGMDGEDRHGICLNAVQMRELEAGTHAMTEMLSHSELKALLKPAQATFTSSQKPSEKSVQAKQKDHIRTDIN